MTHCLNCGNVFEGDFCPRCGQAARTKRLRLSEIVSNFVGSFVGGDNRFLNTCRDLIIRPGHMAREYLLGTRIRYYNPLQMYVFALTIYAVLSYVIGVSNSIFDDMSTLDFGTDPLKNAYMNFILQKITALTSNKLYGTLLVASFAALSYRWVFRRCRLARRDGQQLVLNLTEQFYVQMYHSCLGLLISIAMLPLCLIKGIDVPLSTVYQVITVAYIIVFYRQLLGLKWWKSIVLNLVGLFLILLLFLIVLILITIPAGFVEGM